MKKVISMIVAIAMLVTMFSTVINLGTAFAASHDYGKALTQSVQFFDGNKCGKDVAADNVFSWRGACHTTDKGPAGEDLTGGYHDAGDHVKFGLPGAYSASMLGWAMYEYKSVIASTGNTEKLLSTLKYFTDYFLKCHPNANTFYHQVGAGGSDHGYWGPPELQTTDRPVKVVNANTTGSDVASETAAALALMYLNYKDVDATYANKCLAAAKSLYALAKSKIGPCDEESYYRPNAIYDDMAWAAIWLYIAGGQTDATLLADAEEYSVQKKLNSEDPLKHIWTLCWDDVYLASYVKLAQLTGKAIYKDAMAYTFNYWKNTIRRTSGGLIYLNNWGVLRYASGEAALAFMYSNLVEKDQALVDLFKTQIDYALGTNPRNMSYLIGYGSTWPKHPHHRAAHPEQGASEAKYELTGALVGGPDSNDGYNDNVNMYEYTEVALDYNANFMLAVTSYLGTTTNLPPPPTPSIIVNPTPSNPGTGFRVNIGTASGMNGGTVKVPINFVNVPANGISTSDFKVTYDATKLQFVDATAGSIVTNAATNLEINKESDGVLKVLFLDYTMKTQYITSDGVFADLNFKVITSTQTSTPVQVSGAATFADKTLASVSATISNGAVALNGGTLVSPTPTKTVVPTITVVPTKTPTPPPPPTIISSNLKVEFSNSMTTTTSNGITPKFRLTNTGSSPIKLSDVKLRYYYTIDGDKPQQFWCDWSPVGGSNVTGTFVKMPTAYPNGDYYLEIGFSSAAGDLAANASIEVQGRFAKNDWSNYDQSNDYSFTSTATSYTTWDKVTAYISGNLVFGKPIGPVIVPTPSVTPSKTPTNPATPTSTPTKTPPQNAMLVNIDTVTADPGTNVTVPITFTKVPVSGVSTCDMVITYDSSKLTFVDAAAGSIVTNATTNLEINEEAPGKIRVLFLDYTMKTEYITSDGVFANLNFTVKSTAPKGTTAAVGVDGTATFADKNLQAVPTAITNGGVEIPTGPIAGLKVNIGKVQAEAGKSVSVPINFVEVPANGISTCDMTLTYDSSKLTFVDATAGSIVTNAATNLEINEEEPGKIKVLFLDYTMKTQYITSDGVFANLNFTAKSTAAGTTSPISKEGTATFADKNLQAVNATVTNGSVTITDGPAVTPTPTVTSSATPSATPSGPVGDFNVKIGKVEGKPGQSVVVPVNFEGVSAEGISTCDMTITYDTSKLEFVDSEAGSIVTNPATNLEINEETPGKIKVLFLDYTMKTQYITASGVFANLNFNIKSTAPVNTTAAVAVDGAATFANKNLQAVNATITNGEVAIGDGSTKLRVAIQDAEGAPGANVVVPVVFTDVPAEGISTCDMTITYDTSKLEFVDSEAGIIVVNPGVNLEINEETPGKIKVLFLDYTMKTQFISMDGIFANLNFLIKSTAPVNTTAAVSIDATTATFANSLLKAVAANIIPGSVAIKEGGTTGYKVTGYIAPDFLMTDTTAPIVKAGFKVEVVGTTKSAVTDSNGYFEITGVEAGTYTIKIAKANYLTRQIANVAVSADKQMSTSANPILMWAGDVEIGGVQDGAINMEDIMEICKAFNSYVGQDKYQERLDLNKDGAVNMEDIMIVAKHFNKLPSDY